MIRLNARSKILIGKLKVTPADRLKTFELRVPANSAKITAVTVTTNIFIPFPKVLGKLTFQANDNTDIFLVAEVIGNGSMPSDESVLGIPVGSLEDGGEWVTGYKAARYPVTVQGDTVVILCTYRTLFPIMFSLTAYAEYEEIDALDKTPDHVLREAEEEEEEVRKRKLLPRRI